MGAWACRSGVVAMSVAIVSAMATGMAAANPDVSKEDAPAGLSSGADYQVVATFTGTLAAGRIDASWAMCPAGMVATGGGVHTDSAGGVVMLGASPTSDPENGDGWMADIKNTSAESVRYTGYVICVSGVADLARHSAPYEEVPAGGERTVTASCGEGRKVLGGGAFSATTGGHLASTYPDPGEAGWSGSVRDISGSGTQVTTKVVCGNGVHDLDVREGEPVRFGPGDQIAATVACPADTVVLSAGARSVEGSATLTDIFPVSERTWKVYAVGGDDRPDDALQAWAVCGRI